MTTLLMNPDNLKQQIDDLRDLAAGADLAKQSIDLRSDLEHDPLGSTEMSDFCIKAANAIADVQSRADDIELCMNKIIEVNESGVGSMDADGMIELELPDYVAIESSTSLVSWAQGVQDAVDIQQVMAGKVTKSGRTYEEIIASIQENQESFVYADSFIETVGAENLTSLPLTSSPNYMPVRSQRTAEVLGTLLATASTEWDSDRSQEVVDAIMSSIDSSDPEAYQHVIALNTMLGGHDANGDHVNDLYFAPTFLLQLADSLDDTDADTFKLFAKRYPGTAPGASSREVDAMSGGADPMEGVLDAMGNNPSAALDYLATASDDGENGADTTVLETLAARDWDESGFAGFTAAVAAASSLRSSTNESIAARAEQAAGVGIHELAEHTGGDEDLYNDDAKARVGLLLANCAPEVASVYRAEQVGDPSTAYDPSCPECWLLPVASEADVLDLTYRIADSADATATIGTGFANMMLSNTAQELSENAGNQQAQTAVINDVYSDGAHAVAYLAGVADAKAEAIDVQQQDDAEGQVSAATAALTAFITVAAGAAGTVVGGPAGAAIGSTMGQATVAAVTTMTAPLAADALVSDPETSITLDNERLDSAVWAAAVQQAANNGLLSQDSLKPLFEQKVATGGAEYAWVKQDPTTEQYYIDLSDATASDYMSLNSWTTAVKGSGDRLTGDSGAIVILEDDFNGEYSDGKDAGRSYGSAKARAER